MSMAKSDKGPNIIVPVLIAVLVGAVVFNIAFVVFAHQAGFFRIVLREPAPAPRPDTTEIDRILEIMGREKEAIASGQKRLEEETLKVEALKKQLDLNDRSLQTRQQQVAGYMDEIKKSLGGLEAEKEKRLIQLVKMFTAMKPAEAVPVFEKMDNETIAAILMRMKSKVSAKILEQMNPRQASLITEIIKQR
jgi:flagellar motility protein MotE (MotC chaperone)